MTKGIIATVKSALRLHHLAARARVQGSVAVTCPRPGPLPRMKRRRRYLAAYQCARSHARTRMGPSWAQIEHEGEIKTLPPFIAPRVRGSKTYAVMTLCTFSLIEIR